MPVHSRQTIDDFLAQKRIAFVGVSRNPSDFSRQLFTEFVRLGYDMIPVNPATAEIDARKCHLKVTDIQPRPDAVLVMTKAGAVDQVVADCVDAGIPRVWLYRAAGRGAVTESAVALCRQNGIAVVAGECPFMFLPGAHWLHRMHGTFNKIFGTYPA